jgi:hypothetical protein
MNHFMPGIMKRLSHWGHIVAVTTVLCLSNNPSLAADLEFKPSVAISEEFTDNIYEVPSNKRTEFITRLIPGFTSRYQTPFWDWNLGYTLEYRRYEQNTRSDSIIHNLNLRGNIALVENFMFLDLSDIYSQVPLDVARNNTATESSRFVNLTKQNTATMSPYVNLRLKGDNTLRTGYRYTDIRYWDSNGIDNQEHRGFAELTHAVTAKLSLSAGYAFTRLESQTSSFNRHDLSSGFRYEYAERSFVFGQIGNSWQQFDRSGDANYLFWNAGVTHDFNFVVATIETRVVPTVDPLSVSTKETRYSGRLERILQRGMIALSTSYTEYENTRTNLVPNRHTLTVSATGRYEVLQSLTVNLTATGDRFSRNTASDYPYRFTGVAGLSYAFMDALTLAITYTYINNLRDPNAGAAAYQVNNAILELRKTF